MTPFKEATRNSATFDMRVVLCPWASHLLCIGLKENKTEWDSKNFLSKGTCHFINWWGYLAKSQCRYCKEPVLSDQHIQLPHSAMLRTRETMPVVWAVQIRMGARTSRQSQVTIQVAFISSCYTTRQEILAWVFTNQKEIRPFFYKEIEVVKQN